MKHYIWLLIAIAVLLQCALFIAIGNGKPEPARTVFIKYSPEQLGEIYCIAHAVYHEARGESQKGQLAVAYVVLNRVKHGGYPSDACNTVYQKHQFTDVKNTNPSVATAEWTTAVQIAEAAYFQLAADPTKGAKYYYAPKKTSTPKWAIKKTQVVDIGNHKFFNLK